MASEGRGFLRGFLIGAAVGAGIALALTREDAREVLLGKAKEAGNFAKDATSDLRGKVAGTASQWQTNANELYERGRQVIENARGSFQSSGDEVRDEATARAERLRSELQFPNE
jgi:gas vesicle protein